MQRLKQPRDLKKDLGDLSQTAAPALAVFSAWVLEPDSKVYV